MSEGTKFCMAVLAVVVTMFFVGVMFVDYMDQRNHEREIAEANNSLGITQTVVGGVKIICQRGQNCICLDSWSNKQLECKFTN